MRIYLIAIIVLFTQLAIGQVKTDWDKMRLKGKIQKLETGRYSIEDSDTLYSTNDYYHFNEKGFIDSVETLGEISPNSYSNTIYLYNSKSVLINTVKSISEDGQFANYAISDWRRRKYFYNGTGKLAKIKEVNSDTVLTREIKYKYDDSGRIKKVTDNNINQSNIEVTNWTYNKNGSFSNKTSTRRKFREVKYFNKQGRKVKSQWTQPIKSKEFTEYKYSWENDAKGNWIHRKTSSREVKPSINEVIWESRDGTYRKITYYK